MSKTKDKTKSFFLIFGNDDSRVERACRQMIQDLMKVHSDQADLETINFENSDSKQPEESLVRQLIESLKTPSFFNSQKIVWLRAGDYFKNSSSDDSLATVVLNLLEQSIPESILLIVSCRFLSPSAKLYEWFSNRGQVQEFSVLSTDKKAERAQLDEWVQAQFSKSGKKIQPQALNQFIEITGHDSALLSGEIEKLIVFTSGVPVITLEHVEKITSGDKQTIFWKLRDAVGKRSLPQALEVLDQLLEQQESPIQLLASLVHTVSDLLSVRRLVESGILSESFAGRRYWEIEKAWKEHLAEAKTRAEQESEKAFLSKHPFVVFQAIQSAQYFSRQDLREGLNALSRADELLKSTPLKPHWILEPLLFQMLSKDRIKNS